MIYKIRYDCAKRVLLSLYFSLFQSHLSYGLSVWDTSNSGYLSKLAIQQTKVVRAITFSDFYAHTLPLFKSLNILKIKDLFNHKIGSLMWDFNLRTLPDYLAFIIIIIFLYWVFETTLSIPTYICCLVRI